MGCSRVADDRDGHRREVVVDRADALPMQGVDQSALALLELADDADDRVGPGDALGDLREPFGQILAVARGGAASDLRRDTGRRGYVVERQVQPEGSTARPTRRHRARSYQLVSSRGVLLPQSVRVYPLTVAGHVTSAVRKRRLGALTATPGVGAASGRAGTFAEGDSMEYSLGIDLGTTYSAAATARDDRLEIFQLGERAATIPSIVVLRADGEVLTGEAAERRALAEPTRTGPRVQAPPRRPDADHPRGNPVRRRGACSAHLLRAIVPAVTRTDGRAARGDRAVPPRELRRIQDRPPPAGRSPGRCRSTWSC